jgi:hypothetical protein
MICEPEPIVSTAIHIKCISQRQDGTEAVLIIDNTEDFYTIDRKHLTLLEALQMHEKIGTIQKQLFRWIQAKLAETYQ